MALATAETPPLPMTFASEAANKRRVLSSRKPFIKPNRIPASAAVFVMEPSLRETGQIATLIIYQKTRVCTGCGMNLQKEEVRKKKSKRQHLNIDQKKTNPQEGRRRPGRKGTPKERTRHPL